MDEINLLTELVGRKSETPDDGGILDLIAGILPDFESERIDKNGVKNLWMTKRFGDGPHLCFCGHVDVVPAGEGWKSDPYDPIEQDGFIYGRGTQDMKSGVAAMVIAFKECQTFQGRLSLLLTGDEEGDAEFGTVEVLKQLKERGELPDFAVVGEPTCEEHFGDAVKVGRRGSVNGFLELFGKQGHAAYPEKADNPVEKIAPILYKIAGRDLDQGDEFFAPSKFVITDIRGGVEKTNVTPGSLKLIFNVRNSTATTPEQIETFVHEHFEGRDYQLDLRVSSRPFRTNQDSPVVSAMSEAIRQICGVTPNLSTAGGTSDARFLAEYGIECVEFGVINDRIHAVDERVQVEEVRQLKAVYTSLIENFPKEM